MKLRYFASIRECIGVGEESIELPAHITTIADLIGWLSKRGDEYERAFSSHSVRVAIDQNHVKLDAMIAGAQEIAFFPPMTGG
jgi:sulfur-carrier protein